MVNSKFLYLYWYQYDTERALVTFKARPKGTVLKEILGGLAPKIIFCFSLNRVIYLHIGVAINLIVLAEFHCLNRHVYQQHPVFTNDAYFARKCKPSLHLLHPPRKVSLGMAMSTSVLQLF